MILQMLLCEEAVKIARKEKSMRDKWQAAK